MTLLTRLLTIFLFLSAAVACTGAPPTESILATKGITTPQPPNQQNNETTSPACPLTDPAWIKPPDDAAVQDPPEFGYYFVNDDRSIWASAWWTDQEDSPLRASEDGIKMGWFRPAGAVLEVNGQRLDAQAPPLEADIPCCYPTRFQATGLYFPTEGCWEVKAKAAESELSFVVRVF